METVFEPEPWEGLEVGGDKTVSREKTKGLGGWRRWGVFSDMDGKSCWVAG